MLIDKARLVALLYLISCVHRRHRNEFEHNRYLITSLYKQDSERRQLMTIINELDSTCGVSDEELTLRFKESIRIDNEVRKIKGLPIAGYDDETKKAYLEYPDGRREYVGE